MSRHKKIMGSKTVINLPKLKPWWVLLGPAFIWAATAQGSGELIWWPYLVARYGKAFLFLLLPAAFIQFFVNREISRYTALTGRGIWSGFLSLGKWYAAPLFCLCFVSFLWFGGYATAGGSSLYEVLGWPNWGQRWGSVFWGYILVILFTLALFMSKVAYRLIESIMKVVTAIILVGLVTSAVLIGKVGDFIDFLTGLFDPRNLGVGVDWSDFDHSKLITGLVFAGMGGFLNLMYSYWVKDKGVGLAHYGDKMSGLLSGRRTKSKIVRYVVRDSKGNWAKWKGWVRYLNLDSGLAVAINMVTIILTSFLSFVLLWPERNYPEGWSITVSQAKFFEASFGAVGRVVFLIVVAAFLVDTWLALADGVSRQMADFSFGFWGKKKKLKTENDWYNFWLIFWVGVSLLTMPLASPGVLMNMIGVISVFAFVLYIPALWYLNYVKVPRHQPEFTRQGWWSGAMLAMVWLVYAGLAGWYLLSV